MAMQNRSRRKSRITTKEVDYSDVGMLRACISETGKIIPSRITGAAAKTQRKITEAIKRARFLALIPYCDQHD